MLLSPRSLSLGFVVIFFVRGGERWRINLLVQSATQLLGLLLLVRLVGDPQHFGNCHGVRFYVAHRGITLQKIAQALNKFLLLGGIHRGKTPKTVGVALTRDPLKISICCFQLIYRSDQVLCGFSPWGCGVSQIKCHMDGV